MIDFFASEPQFVAQIASTWLAMPVEWRGYFGVHGSAAARSAIDRGVTPVAGVPDGPNPILVASYGDLKRVRTRPRPVIYSEHGAGQTYPTAGFSNYIGGSDRDMVVGCLVPGPIAAVKARAAYPSIPVFEVGCPRLDAVHRNPSSLVPGVAFHWNGAIPETRTAFPHYRPGLQKLPGVFGRVVGHSHPKIMARHAPRYATWGFDVLWRSETVFETVGVLAVDNSSVMWEAALLGIPVAVLNCPSYRREVDHGMRFWEFADIGPNANHPNELVDVIRDALADTETRRARRREITDQIYAYRPGFATRAAVAATIEIAELAGSTPSDGAGRSMHVMAIEEWSRPMSSNPYAPRRRVILRSEARARSLEDSPTVLETDQVVFGDPVVIDEPQTGTSSDALDVPDGTVGEVVEWVDGDPERATVALAVEHQRDKPRQGVLNALEPLVDGER